MRRLLGLVVLLTLATLTGCSASSGDSAEMMAVGGADSAADLGEADTAAPPAGYDATTSGSTAASDRQFIVSGSVALTVENVRRAVRDAALIVEHVGGHVQERVEEGDGDGSGSAYLVVRIPSADVTATLEQIEKLGTVTDTHLTSTEVTAQVRDLDARIRALRVSVARLEDLLSRADSVSDVVQAEQMLTDRQADLESLLSQREALGQQVDLATFRLDIWTEESEPEEPATGFLAGLVTGWKSLVATLGGALQVLGVLLPWLIFAALVTAVVVPLVRRSKLRKASTAPPSAPLSGGPVTPVAPMAPVAPRPGPTSQPVPTSQPGPVPPPAPVVPPSTPVPAPTVPEPPAETAPVETAPAETKAPASKRPTQAPRATRPKKAAPPPPSPED